MMHRIKHRKIYSGGTKIVYCGTNANLLSFVRLLGILGFLPSGVQSMVGISPCDTLIFVMPDRNAFVTFTGASNAPGFRRYSIDLRFAKGFGKSKATRLVSRLKNNK